VVAVSVIVPTRNRRHLIARAITSVQRQSMSDWELVVVDDASDDDTAQLVRELGDPAVRVVRLDTQGERSAARNRGLAEARAEAVLFLDDDDELRPGALHCLLAGLAAHPRAVASVGGLHFVDEEGAQPLVPRRSFVHDPTVELLAGWVAIGGQTLTRTSAVRGVGGYRTDLSVAEDQELWMRLLTRGPVAFVPQIVLDHRPHGLAKDLPTNLPLEARLRDEYLRTLPDDQRRLASRAVAARFHLRAADINAQLGDFKRARREMVAGVRAAPNLLRSPIVGAGLRAGLAKLVVAGALPSERAHQARRAIRRLRARARGGDR
jgi:glycosyltransferase involved in cell wall biosynthesis